MNIIIKLIDGKKHSLDVNDNITVLLLKYIIYEKFNYHVESQRLIHDGYPLVDEFILQKSKLSNNVIHLIFQMNNCNNLI